MRPVPRVKRLLSDGAFLPHIVQLLLTFDPSLVEKVAKLLCEVSMEQQHAGKTIFCQYKLKISNNFAALNQLPFQFKNIDY